MILLYFFIGVALVWLVARWMGAGNWSPAIAVLVCVLGMSPGARADNGNPDNYCYVAYFNHGALAGSTSFGGSMVSWCVNSQNVPLAASVQEHITTLAGAQGVVPILTMDDFGEYWMGAVPVGRRWETTTHGTGSNHIYTAMDYTMLRVKWVKGSNFVTVTNDAAGSFNAYITARSAITTGLWFTLDAPIDEGGNMHPAFSNGGGQATAVGVYLKLSEPAGVTEGGTTEPDVPVTEGDSWVQGFAQFFEDESDESMSGLSGYITMIEGYESGINRGRYYTSGEVGDVVESAAGSIGEFSNNLWGEEYAGKEVIVALGGVKGVVVNLAASVDFWQSEMPMLFFICKTFVSGVIAWNCFVSLIDGLCWSLGWVRSDLIKNLYVNLWPYSPTVQIEDNSGSRAHPMVCYAQAGPARRMMLLGDNGALPVGGRSL